MDISGVELTSDKDESEKKQRTVIREQVERSLNAYGVNELGISELSIQTIVNITTDATCWATRKFNLPPILYNILYQNHENIYSYDEQGKLRVDDKDNPKLITQRAGSARLIKGNGRDCGLLMFGASYLKSLGVRMDDEDTALDARVEYGFVVAHELDHIKETLKDPKAFAECYQEFWSKVGLTLADFKKAVGENIFEYSAYLTGIEYIDSWALGHSDNAKMMEKVRAGELCNMYLNDYKSGFEDESWQEAA